MSFKIRWQNGLGAEFSRISGWRERENDKRKGIIKEKAKVSEREVRTQRGAENGVGQLSGFTGCPALPA